MDRFSDPDDVPGNNGQDGDDTQVNGAEEGQILLSTLVMKSAVGLAGAEARNKAAVLLQVVGYLHRVKLDGSVEVAEA